MKIGVLITAYNCDDYIKNVLEPWLELRDELNLILVGKQWNVLRLHQIWV